MILRHRAYANRLLFAVLFLGSCLTIFVTAPSIATPAAMAVCDSTFRALVQHVDEDTFVNGVKVTGGDQYPLEMVQAGLNLFVNPLRQGDIVISVGEGFSPLVPAMRAQGIDITGVDIWYGIDQDQIPNTNTGAMMRDYIRANEGGLIQGNAFRLPFQDNSVDVYLSNLLINNIRETDSRRAILREALRVTKSGGNIRIFGFRRSDFANMQVVFQEFGIDPINVNFYTPLDGSTVIPERLRGWGAGQFLMEFRVP